MDIKGIYARARRGVRDDVKLYLVAVSSLTVAFLCLATMLLGVANLAELADHWGRSHRMSVYLQDGAPAADVARLTSVLASLPSVQHAAYASAELAREQFLLGHAKDQQLRGL